MKINLEFKPGFSMMGLNMQKAKAIFVCQITDNSLKVIKYLVNRRRELTALEAEKLSADTDDKALAERLNRVFKKLGYFAFAPVIVSLPRNQATCRYLRVPTQTPEEIEKIASLQASRYLPYSANELITGYQVISGDKDGFSQINLVIVHKDVIGRYLRIFDQSKITKFNIVLSSYGLSNLYGSINMPDHAPAMIADIDCNNVELAVISDKKMIFSRYFKFNKTHPQAEDLFCGEIRKTRDAYVKETGLAAPEKIVILGADKKLADFSAGLNKHLPVEFLSYSGKISLPDNLANSLLDSEDSFASLIGLGLGEIEESLNILPPELKEKIKKFSRYQGRLRTALAVSAILIIWFLALAKNLDNKAKYLRGMKTELIKIEKEAQPLEEIERRFRLLQKRKQKKPTSLDLLYELHKVMPEEISLVNFNYEEDAQTSFKGQAAGLNPVFTLVSRLEKSEAFRGLTIKVRYATKRSSAAGEIVDFEIICLRK